jgi:hypothetical protein
MAIAAGIRLVLGKIKHKTYLTYTSTITAWLTACFILPNTSLTPAAIAVSQTVIVDVYIE